MVQTLIRNWWLLALCGVLDAISSGIYFTMPDSHARGTIIFLGMLSVAAGACAIAAGIWRSAKGKCWLLVLNGLALGSLGLLLTGIFGPRISLLSIALLIVVAALSLGTLEFVTARGLPHHVPDQWFLGLTGAVLGGFALAFLALGLHWIRLASPPHGDFLMFGSFFSFSALCLLGMGLRLNSLRGTILVS